LELRRRWVVITGGSSGIGAETGAQIARLGNRVTLVADGAPRLVATANALRSEGLDVDHIRCDIGDQADVAGLLKLLLSQPTKPDALINNAGFGTYTPFANASAQEVERLLEVNLTGHVRLTHGLIPAMVERRSGAISFIASLAGRLPITPNATYCAAKHGMLGLAQALRYEVRSLGVEVTAVCPGRVDTSFFDHPTFRERTRGPENKSSIPVDRAGRTIIKALESARPVTYVPLSLGVAAWLYDTVPIITRPLYGRMMKARMERLYADLER